MNQVGLVRGGASVSLILALTAPVYGASPKAAPATGPTTSAVPAPAGSTAPSPAAPGATPSPEPTPPAGSEATPPAASDAPPATGDGAAPTPAPDAAPQAEEPAPKKAKRRHHVVDDDEDDDEDAEESRHERRRRRLDEESHERRPEPEASVGLLGNSHFILGAEGITSVLAWSSTVTIEPIDPQPNLPQPPLELGASGTDVAFLGQGFAGKSPYAIPRLSIHGMTDGGFTFGGSIAYMVSSGKHDDVTTNGNGALDKVSKDSPTETVFLFAPRVGVMLPASPTAAFWLRGGMTRVSASVDTPADPNPSLGGAYSSTVTTVAVSLDPQLVLTPLPHVGILLGLDLNFPVTGTVSTTIGSTTADHPASASAYGVSLGLALFL